MLRNLLQSGTATQREKGRRGLPDAQRHRDRRESRGRERRGRPQRVSERCNAAGCLSPARCVGAGHRGRRLCARCPELVAQRSRDVLLMHTLLAETARSAT
jgi:hypothetical protein